MVLGLSSADDDGVEEVPGGSSMLLDAFVKSGGVHCNKYNDADDRYNNHNHDGGQGQVRQRPCFLTQQPALWLDSFLVERGGWRS